MSQISHEQCWRVPSWRLNKCQIVVNWYSKIWDFVGHNGWTGQTDLAEHGIDEQDSTPVKRTYQSVPLAKQKVVDKQIYKMLQQGIIEPSNSPRGFPTVLVTEKDSSVRFCEDFRLLNSLSRNTYPLPGIDETLNTLGGAEWFCTLDLTSGMWQVKMKDEDKPKTAFMTRRGLFQFHVMPFGLSGAQLRSSSSWTLCWGVCNGINVWYIWMISSFLAKPSRRP